MSDTHTAEQPMTTAARIRKAKDDARQAALPKPSSAEMAARARIQANADLIARVQKDVDELSREVAESDNLTLQNRLRAARAELRRLKDGEAAHVVPQTVWATVRQRGAGKISMGEHIAAVGDVYFDKGERVELPLDVARVYEDRAWIDIDEPAEAAA
jgi:hypothetical protein